MSVLVGIHVGVFSLLETASNSDDFHRQIQLVDDLLQLHREADVRFFVGPDFFDSIDESIFDVARIQYALKVFDIYEWSAMDLSTSICSILEQVSSIRELFDISYVIADPVDLDPDILLNCHGSGAKDELRSLVIMMAFLQQFMPSLVGGLFAFVGGVSTTSTVVRAHLRDIDPKRPDLFQLKGDRGVELNQALSVAGDFWTSLEHVINRFRDHESMSDDRIEWHVVSAVRRTCSSEWTLAEIRCQFCFGKRFCDSVRQIVCTRGRSTLDKIVRAVAETIVRERERDTHPLRIDRGGGSRDLIRDCDGAKAWRRDVDRDVHLHYWKLGRRRVELSKVGPHNDMGIY